MDPFISTLALPTGQEADLLTLSTLRSIRGWDFAKYLCNQSNYNTIHRECQEHTTPEGPISEMYHLCPVCDYNKLESPAENYMICPSCGTEFGVDDVEYTPNELREIWIKGGRK